ncbi:MAG: helix-turn-helix domain-containing protein [Deltaproteobacteria bacterium]|nr:helix-turn-helix domain-containing protein [Deltaproteobacteria bacterium]
MTRHKPTEEARARVAALACKGATHRDIARAIDTSVNTLRRYYRRELDQGEALANIDIAGVLYSKAMAGDLTACIFWLKCRAGWCDRPDSLSDQERAVISMVRLTGLSPASVREGLLHWAAKELQTTPKAVAAIEQKAARQ